MAHKQAWSFPPSRKAPVEDTFPKPPKGNPGRVYTAFYSPREIPGVDPALFSYRKVPQTQHADDDVPVYAYDTPAVRSEVPHEDDEGVAGTSWHGGSAAGSDAPQHVLGPQFFQYLNTLPYALLRKFLDPTSPTVMQGRLKRAARDSEQQIFCEWSIKTEPGLYLLMTFSNLSAAYSVDCHGAYIEVERENNGYDARWCGNGVAQAGSRAHVIFAKTEVRITVYDDGDVSKTLPTGFEANIEVIDLFNSQDYTAFMKSNAYPHIRRLLLG